MKLYIRKTLSLALIIILTNTVAIGQILDSIKLIRGTLNYTSYGTGTPIILLSGGPGYSSTMLEPIAYKMALTFKTILFDQRGTGKSTITPLDSTTINLTQAANDIRTLKKKLSANKVILLGHSWGAMLALYYTIKYPDEVEKLVLVGPGPLNPRIDFADENRMGKATTEEKDAMKKMSDSLANGTSTSETFNYLGKIYLRLDTYDAAKVDSLLPIVLKGGQPNFIMAELMWNDVLRHYNVEKAVSNLKVPTLVICGRQDPVGIFPTFELSNLNRRFIINWIDKCGHFSFLEQPHAFYDALVTFLNNR